MLLAVLAAAVAVLIGPPLGVAAAQAAAPVYAYDYTVRLYEQPSNYATPGRASSIATFRVGGSARQPEIQYGSRGGEPGPSADGTAFAYNYEGTSHVFQHPNSPEAASVARGHSSVLQPDAVAAKTVDDLPTVNWGQQSKHFPGHPNFISGRSTLTANPQALIQRAGTGTPVGSVSRGQAGFKERIDFGDSIGAYVSRDGASSPTSIGILHYRADGSVHIIPGRPQ